MEDNLQNEEDPKNEDGPKIKDDPKKENEPKLRMNQDEDNPTNKDDWNWI